MPLSIYGRIGSGGSRHNVRRLADENLPALARPTPTLFRCAGVGEGTNVSVARRILRLGLLALFVAGTQSARSESPQNLRQYGAGVQAFFSHQVLEAIDHFDRAIAGGIRDPRCYYFRGLAHRRLGNVAAAEVDFSEGARLEVLLGRRDVGMSLQRVQGPDRLALETFRRKARQMRDRIVAEARAARAARAAEPPRRALTSAEIPARFRDPPADSTDPFANDIAGRLGTGPIQATETASPSLAGDEIGDPFGDDPDQLDSETDPFGSGVPESTASAEEDAFGEGLTPPDSQASRGPIGAVFRAIGRTALPNAAEAANQGREMIRQLPIPGRLPVPGSQEPDSTAGEPVIQGDEPAEDDPFGTEGEDIFEDF